MTVHIGADHRGFALKEFLAKRLFAAMHDVHDHGALAFEPADDYPDFARAVALAVAADPSARGMLICGSGAGMAIAANRISGIRASIAHSPAEAHAARADEDANVLCLGADHLDEHAAWEIVLMFLTAPASHDERHVRRRKKLG